MQVSLGRGEVAEIKAKYNGDRRRGAVLVDRGGTLGSNSRIVRPLFNYSAPPVPVEYICHSPFHSLLGIYTVPLTSSSAFPSTTEGLPYSPYPDNACFSLSPGKNFRTPPPSTAPATADNPGPFVHRDLHLRPCCRLRSEQSREGWASVRELSVVRSVRMPRSASVGWCQGGQQLAVCRGREREVGKCRMVVSRM